MFLCFLALCLVIFFFFVFCSPLLGHSKFLLLAYCSLNLIYFPFARTFLRHFSDFFAFVSFVFFWNCFPVQLLARNLFNNLDYYVAPGIFAPVWLINNRLLRVQTKCTGRRCAPLWLDRTFRIYSFEKILIGNIHRCEWIVYDRLNPFLIIYLSETI